MAQMTQAEIKAKTDEWLRKKIDTPTFELTSVEKPDMSPFLVHLTGKNSLISIIKGEGAADQLSGKGFLRSGIPSYAMQGTYHAPVVCFTESPLFALDFFRIRTPGRFFMDQRYGIGFSKSALACRRNVRPVLYLDAAANGQLLRIIKLAEEGKVSINDVNSERLLERLKLLKPLMFPIFEGSAKQGFMWEREWRYPKDDGFVFDHDEIKIICCPAEERNELISHLGRHATGIRFVENWQEYNELVTYLKSLEELPKGEEISNVQDIGELLAVQQSYENMLYGLNAYKKAFAGDTEFHNDYLEQAIQKVLLNHNMAERQLEYLTSLQQEMMEEMHKDFVDQQIREAFDRTII